MKVKILSILTAISVAACAILAAQNNRYRKENAALTEKAETVNSLENALQQCTYQQSPTDIWSWESSLRKYHINADIAFIGDSLTQRGDFSPYFPDLDVYNLGIGGDSIEGVSSRITMIDAVEAEKAFIMIGFNDIQPGMTEQEVYDMVYQKYSDLLENLFSKYPDMKVYIQSILPITTSAEESINVSNAMIRSADEAVRKAASDYQLTYIDLYSVFADDEGNLPEQLSEDGIHITSDSYQLWAEAVKSYVYE